MEENEKKMGKEEEKGKGKREKMRDLIQILKIWGVPVAIILWPNTAFSVRVENMSDHSPCAYLFFCLD